MLHAPTRSQPLIRVNVYLTQEQRESLFQYSTALDISAAEIVRRILEAGLPRIAQQVAAAKRRKADVTN